MAMARAEARNEFLLSNPAHEAPHTLKALQSCPYQVDSGPGKGSTRCNLRNSVAHQFMRCNFQPVDRQGPI